MGIECSNCGDILNNQTGFDFSLSSWVCLNCGSIHYGFFEEDGGEDYDEDEIELHPLVERLITHIALRPVRKERRRSFFSSLTGKKGQTGISSDDCKEMDCEELIGFFRRQGFYEFELFEDNDLECEDSYYYGMVSSVLINDKDSFTDNEVFRIDSLIAITFHSYRKHIVPFTNRSVKGENKDDVSTILHNAGFANTYGRPICDIKRDWFKKKDTVTNVYFGDSNQYRKKDVYRVDTKVVIEYRTLRKYKGFYKDDIEL